MVNRNKIEVGSLKIRKLIVGKKEKSILKSQMRSTKYMIMPRLWDRAQTVLIKNKKPQTENKYITRGRQN